MHSKQIELPRLRISTLTYVGVLASLVAAYGMLAVWKENSPYAAVADMPSEFHSTLSLVLGCLLVFRTNTAYNRWWEARTLWGTLVNVSRNLAAKLTDLVEVPQREAAEARQIIVAFGYALRDHLRDERPAELPSGVPELSDGVQHVPLHLARELYRRLKDWRKAGYLDGDELRVVDEELNQFLHVCGGCERIRRTRLARSYRRFARQCVLLFLLTLPWGIVNEFQWWTIPVTGLLAYFMLGLEVVAGHVEEPFGFDDDDLALDDICGAIKTSVGEVVP